MTERDRQENRRAAGKGVAKALQHAFPIADPEVAAEQAFDGLLARLSRTREALTAAR